MKVKIKLRLGVLPINRSFRRRTFKKDTNYMCKSCDVLEDEEHFIRDCVLYRNLRQKYLDSCNQPYVILLKKQSVSTVRSLGMYIFNALKVRQEFTESLEN